MKYRNIVVAASLALLPLTAQAQPVSGMYVGAGLGVNQLLDTHYKNIPGSNLSSNIGFAGVASVGYGFGNGFRTELEANYRGQHSRLNPGGIGKTTSSYGPMLNVLYDFNIGGGASPYVGLGAGAQWTRVSNSTWGGAPALAGQAILGVAVPLGTPGLSLTAEARALRDFSDARVQGGRLREPMNVSGLIGLRYAFGAPPAPVSVAAPAPVQQASKAEDARTYLLFFDWDKSDLTGRAREIIADAAGASQRLAVTRLEVAGHADTSGTPGYNQALSMRRAQTVAVELQRLGVKKEAISISAFGDTKPLVQTAAGVREPQNRRVEIVLK